MGCNCENCTTIKNEISPQKKSRATKIKLMRILTSGAMLLLGIILFGVIKLKITWLSTTIYCVAFLIVGYDVILGAFKNIIKGKIFGESFLMTIATAGAMIIGEFPEAVAIVLFYQIGEMFEGFAAQRSKKSIASLMDIRPDYAYVKEGESLIKKSPVDVFAGDIIVIKAGEKIPLDGIVVEGESLVDTSALTGESLPRHVSAGQEVISGCINQSGLLTVAVTKEFSQSTVSKILELVQNAASKKSSSERFITRFSRFYTPIVVVAALMIALLPPLFLSSGFTQWIYRALTFLVVSCPCALVVSVPMSFFGGLGGAAKSGILVKGSNYLEVLARADTVVLDKTGTLTEGVFSLQEISVVNQEFTQQQLLEYAAYAEYYSNHPISDCIKKAYGKQIDSSKISNVSEVAGCGVTATIGGRQVAAGNVRLMSTQNAFAKNLQEQATTIHIAIDGTYCGSITIADKIKGDSLLAIDQLKRVGIRQTIMLTGDNPKTAQDVANQLKIDTVYAKLLPQDKVERLQEIMKSTTGKTVFVGDGINDAPVLARADVGIAMGGLGSDAAIEAADIVIMTDQPSKIAQAKKIAKKTVAIALQNTIFAISVKLAVLVLSAFGLANMWMAVFADVGVTFIAVLNALRALSKK